MPPNKLSVSNEGACKPVRGELIDKLSRSLHIKTTISFRYIGQKTRQFMLYNEIVQHGE